MRRLKYTFLFVLHAWIIESAITLVFILNEKQEYARDMFGPRTCYFFLALFEVKGDDWWGESK